MVMPMKKQEEEGLRTVRCVNPDCGVLNLYTSSDKCDVCGVPFESEQSMDYKEKILADIYELVRNEYIDRITLYQRIEQILATLPSEKEIAKRVIKEICTTIMQEQNRVDPITSDMILTRLDKEPE